MSLTRAIAGARIIETAQNYSVADNFSDRPLAVPELPYGPAFYDDEHFWRDILFNPQAAWNTEVHLYEVILSEWVARVPGLFWTPEARSLRQFDESEIEEREPHHVTLQPTAKSRVVTGGVGTLRLPPGAQGTRLATLTTTAN